VRTPQKPRKFVKRACRSRRIPFCARGRLWAVSHVTLSRSAQNRGMQSERQDHDAKLVSCSSPSTPLRVSITCTSSSSASSHCPRFLYVDARLAMLVSVDAPRPAPSYDSPSPANPIFRLLAWLVIGAGLAMLVRVLDAPRQHTLTLELGSYLIG